MTEEWKEIPGFPEYSVSTEGRIWSHARDREMRLSMNQYGVLKVGLFHEGEQTTQSVAVLVAQTFLPDHPEHFDTVIYLNGDRADCRADNLMWRPRWFARDYHRQLKKDYELVNSVFEEINSGEMFENSLDAAQRYGLLEKDVFNDLLDQNAFLPEGQKFQFRA